MEVGDLERFWEVENDNIDIEEEICDRAFLETTKTDKNKEERYSRVPRLSDTL